MLSQPRGNVKHLSFRVAKRLSQVAVRDGRHHPEGFGWSHGRRGVLRTAALRLPDFSADPAGMSSRAASGARAPLASLFFTFPLTSFRSPSASRR